MLRDIKTPSAAINPDYLTYLVNLKDGRTHTSTLRSDGDKLWIGTSEVKEIATTRSSIESLQPSALRRPASRPHANESKAITSTDEPRFSRIMGFRTEALAERVVPMSLLVQCPSCAGKLNVKEELVGKKVRCPKCKTVFPATDQPSAAKPAAPPRQEAATPVVPVPPARPPEEFAFDIRSVSTKHPNGYAYRVTATDQGIAFTCLTVDDKGRRPSEEESAKFDFQLEWDEIAEVSKPATIFDPLVVFVGKDGQKTKCVFAEAGQEVAAFKGLKETFGTLPDVTFIHERTPAWKLLALPVSFTIGMIAIGIIGFFVLANMEETGEGGRVNVIIVLVYKYLGKYGVLGLFLVAAAGGILWSVMKLRKYTSLESSEDE